MDRAVVYQRLLTESSRTAALIKKIVDDAIPADWQTMAFIQNERQAEFYLEHAMPPWGTIAMAKRLTDKERDEVTRGIAEGKIIRPRIFGVHSLRRSAITAIYEHDGLEAAQTLAHHANPKTTTAAYVRSNKAKSLQRSAQTLDLGEMLEEAI